MRIKQRDKIFIATLFGLIFIDHLIKSLGFYFVDNSEFEYIIPRTLWIELFINQRKIEQLLIVNKDLATNSDYWDRLFSMLLIPILLWFYADSKKRQIQRHKRYVLGLLIIGIYMFAAGIIKSNVISIEPNKLFVLTTVIIIGEILTPIGIVIIKDSFFRTIVLLTAASNLGNLISFFYYPYKVIDILGFGLTNRVYNLADIYGYTAYLLFYLSPIYVYLLWRREKHTGPNNRV